jgi:hypothetical protein
VEKGADVALKELESLTEELKKLTQKLRGEVDRGSRMALMTDIQKVLFRIHKGAHG